MVEFVRGLSRWTTTFRQGSRVPAGSRGTYELSGLPLRAPRKSGGHPERSGGEPAGPGGVLAGAFVDLAGAFLRPEAFSPRRSSVPQRPDRIDPRGAPGGHDAGRQRGDRHHHEGGPEGQRVPGAHLVEDVSEERGRCQRHRRAQGHAPCRQHETVGHHEPQQIGGAGPSASRSPSSRRLCDTT